MTRFYLMIVVVVALLNVVSSQTLLEAGQRLIERLLRMLPASKRTTAENQLRQRKWQLQTLAPVCGSRPSCVLYFRLRF